MTDNSIIVVKSGIWYVFSNFALKGVEFITIPLFTRLMTQNEYGAYNNFVSWLQIVLIVGNMYLFPSLYSARYDYEKCLNKYITTMLLVGSFFALTELGIVHFFTQCIKFFFAIEKNFIVLMFIYAMFRPALEIFLLLERLHYHYKSTVVVSSLTTISSVGLSLLMVVLMEDKLCARIYGTYLPLILICIFFYINYLMRDFDFKIEYAKYAVSIAFPYVPHLLAMTVLSSTDRIMITMFCGSEATALYSLAYTCALVVSVLWGAVNAAFAPWLGEKIHNRDYTSINEISTKYVLIVAVPVIGFVLLAPEILLILGGEKYNSAVVVIPPVMLGCFIQFIYSMYVDIEQFMKKTVGMALASIMAALLNFVLNLYFIPKYGFVAAAYTTFIGYFFLLVSHYLLVRAMNLHKLYKTKSFIVTILLLCGISFFSLFLYEHILIRLFVVMLYFIITIYLLLANSRRLKEIIKNKI